MKKRQERLLLRFLQGAVMGAGAILPGVSGGALCAAFGLYLPMMQLCANPLGEFKKSYRTWLSVGFGWLLGFVLFAFVVKIIFEVSQDIAMSLFAGMIFGTFPALFKEAKEGENTYTKERRRVRITAMITAFVLSFALFASIAMAKEIVIPQNTVTFFLCGIFWGLSFIIPGMTSSSVLMLLGLYEPMINGVVQLNFGIILPMILGIIIIVGTLSRAINRMFSRFFAESYYAVIGIVLSSTIMILPRNFAGIGMFFACLGVFAFGIVSSVAAHKLLSDKEV